MAILRGLQARIAPGIELHTITIKLNPFGPPVVTLTGRVRVGNRRVDTSSEATIKTTVLSATGAAYIREVKDLFSPQLQGSKP